MKLAHRLMIVLIVVAVGLAAQGALMAHLEQANTITPGTLGAALDEFPKELGGWVGRDQEIEENLKYGDDHLQRVYVNSATQQQIVLWMIYSKIGKDREHHPEVCMAARGLPEDPTARKQVAVAGHAAPVQQYRFGHLGERQLVYYWHYTLPSSNDDKLNSLQRMYRALRQPRASLTIEIFAPQHSSDNEVAAAEFMSEVDAALQDVVSKEALRGSRRKPVSLTLTDEVKEQPHN